MHGYQIITVLAERTEGGWRPSPGAVYPALSLLADEGLEVNQATLSRDLRALGVVKLPQPDGRSRYVVTPKGPDRAVLVGNLRSFLRELVRSGEDLPDEWMDAALRKLMERITD